MIILESTMKNKTPSYKPGLPDYYTRVCPFSLLYPVVIDNDETRDVYVFWEQDEGKVTLERYPYHRLDEVYRKQLRKGAKKKAMAFYITLALLAFMILFSFRWFQILMGLSCLATLYEFMDRRIRHLWLRREYASNHKTNAGYGITGRSQED